MIIRKRLRHALPALALALALLAGLFTGTAAAADTASDVTFTFTDSGVTASGDSAGGYQISGTDLTISAAGTYTVTGSCADGTITVKKGTVGVTLILSDLTLTSTTSAPLRCNKETGVTLVVTGTNTLTDAEDPANEESTDAAVADAFEGAAVKVKAGASLTITGTGTLNADGSACKNAIKGGSTASITVDGSMTLNLRAANSGLASDGSVEIKSGTLNITAENDGIKSEPDEDDTDSAGIVTISGGTITLSTGDDAIHAAGNLTVTGGEITIDSGDDALHTEYDLVIGTQGSADGPRITVQSCVEGFEGARVYLHSGSGTITASDDGVNAATDAAVSEIAIYVNGGSWYVNAGGDGLDAGGNSQNNFGGDIHLNGGTVEVFGSADNGNSALDFDGSCDASGGTLLAVGMSGMAQTPTSGVYVAFGAGGMGGPGGSGWQGGGVSIQKGSSIEIKDASGNTVYSATAAKSANHVVFASPALTSGASYTLYVNGTQTLTAAAVTGSGQGGQPGGPGGQPGGPGGQQPPDQPGGPGGQQPPDQPGGPGFPGGQPGTGLPFADVAANAWYLDAVRYVFSNGVMTGMSRTEFSPDTNLTRAQMVQILYNLEGRPAVSGGSFTDVAADAWYASAVAWAKSTGVVQGYDESTFGPEDTLTRAQAAAILMRYAQYKGLDTSARAALSFPDAGDVPDWAHDAMQWCVAKGLLQGSDNGALLPNGTATRAQIATIMMRYLTK